MRGWDRTLLPLLLSCLHTITTYHTSHTLHSTIGHGVRLLGRPGAPAGLLMSAFDVRLVEPASTGKKELGPLLGHCRPGYIPEGSRSLPWSWLGGYGRVGGVPLLDFSNPLILLLAFFLIPRSPPECLRQNATSSTLNSSHSPFPPSSLHADKAQAQQPLRPVISSPPPKPSCTKPCPQPPAAV